MRLSDFPMDVLDCVIGDVRDERRLTQAMWGATHVVHAAALKRLDTVAEQPHEAFATNITGTMAVVDAALNAGGLQARKGLLALEPARRVLMLSTDKACQPENAYGSTKLAAEFYTVHANTYGHHRGIISSVLRYGNVLGSRGSAAHTWRRQARAQVPLRITNPDMTRFWITLPQAVDLVFWSFEHQQGGELFVPLLPATQVMTLASAIAEHTGWRKARYEVGGVREGGEKFHEMLLTPGEIARATLQDGPGFRVAVVEPTYQRWFACWPWQSKHAWFPWQVQRGFTSHTPDRWLSDPELRQMLDTFGEESY